MERKYFRFPAYFWEAAQALNEKDRGAYYDALIQYAFTGEAPQLTGMAKNAFELSRWYVDKSNESREKRQ